MIITVDYLADNVVNEELYELCLEQQDKVQRYLNIVENKIKLYMDIEQFKQNGVYDFPEDLKEAVRFLVESLYLNRSLNTTQAKMLSSTKTIMNKYRGESRISPSGRFRI